MHSFLEKPALVTGASGFVGSHTARWLVEQGREVRVLLRKTSNAEAMRDLPVEIFHGDVLDPASLRAAMQGCGTVFHCVVDVRFFLTDPTPLYRTNVDGLVHAMDAALACDIERFVFTSTMGTLGTNPDGPVTEDLPFDWRDRASPYILSRLEAESRFFAWCREKGLPGVALCVANTYGPQDFGPTPHGKALWDTARGRLRFAMDTGAPTVDIRDVAEAALLAESRGRLGERYIIANEFIHNRDFYALATAQLGNPPPRLVPLRVAHAAAWVAERVSKLLGRRDSLVSTDAVFLAHVFQRLDSGKARRELGWSPRPIAETVRDAVAWFAERERALESHPRGAGASPGDP
jgi:dihydroflavonol-4-reductase